MDPKLFQLRSLELFWSWNISMILEEQHDLLFLVSNTVVYGTASAALGLFRFVKISQYKKDKLCIRYQWYMLW